MNDGITGGQNSNEKLNLETGIGESGRLVQSVLNSRAACGGIGELAAYLSKSTGKGVRTRLLLSAAMDENSLVPRKAAFAAAAVELLHMATLVHDDVIDDADTRRGRATLHKEFGNRNAILCGDYLLSMSLTMLADMGIDETLSRTPFVIRFAKTLASICQGEYSQHRHSGNVDLAVLTYLRVISGKTAALFYVSAFMGALIGEETEEAALALGNFGRQMGMVFQIADDCKDYELSEQAAQKPVGNDLRNGIVTLPLILAMRKNPGLRKHAAEAIKNQADINSLLCEVRGAQGPAMAREVAKRFEKKAARLVSALPACKQEALLSIIRSVM